jgi:hypothetical protein
MRIPFGSKRLADVGMAHSSKRCRASARRTRQVVDCRCLAAGARVRRTCHAVARTHAPRAADCGHEVTRELADIQDVLGRHDATVAPCRVRRLNPRILGRSRNAKRGVAHVGLTKTS